MLLRQEMDNPLMILGEGNLSNIPTPMASQTLSAPCTQYVCRELSDYHFRNVHNVKIGFVDAKAKSKINKTLPWLCSKHHMSRKKCIGQAQKMKLLIYTHELNIAKEQDKRLLERNQKKDSSYTCIEESYKRKYRVLQKAMQNCV